ncbi:hypothetical protein KP509_37G046600 [Ceratopteris richardii]|uniref:Uncharacterized protein n=1 Tax=Ceratopteris richardii TaxID=49495 RepID=A0A8T2Q8J8_CERRI|nr:hypothetical protein KP509_37G046600 [Ceratopteris richardii]
MLWKFEKLTYVSFESRESERSLLTTERQKQVTDTRTQPVQGSRDLFIYSSSSARVITRSSDGRFQDSTDELCGSCSCGGHVFSDSEWC